MALAENRKVRPTSASGTSQPLIMTSTVWETASQNWLSRPSLQDRKIDGNSRPSKHNNEHNRFFHA
jgi:hypothetical protein